MRYTDLADEIFTGHAQSPACGVRLATARAGGVTITRVEVAQDGLSHPRGRYITLQTPSLEILDERDSGVVEAAAAELRALLPPQGPVLVLGVGNRRVTADALGPRTVQKVLVTMGLRQPLPLQSIRPVSAVAPGVSAATGVPLRTLARALVQAVRPVAVICVDSLCSSEPARLGRTIQFSDTGLCPAQPGSAKHLDAAGLGVPVVAAGIPTIMEAEAGPALVVTPRALDQVVAHGAALLAAAINRALQPSLTLAQLCWLAG